MATYISYDTGEGLGTKLADRSDFENYAKQIKETHGVDIPVDLIAELDNYLDPHHGPGVEGIYQILSPMVQLGNQYGLTTDQLVQGIKQSGWYKSESDSAFTNGSDYSVGLNAAKKALNLAGKDVNLNTPEIQKYKDQQSQAMYDRIDQSHKGDGGFWGFLGSTLADPEFTLAAGGLLGIGLSGAAAAGGAALGGEAVAPTVGATGAGELGSSGLYSLGSGGGNLGFNASGFLGGESTLGGIGGGGLGFSGTPALTAGWGGFAPYAGSLGSLGGAIDYGLGTGQGNLGFNASGAFGGESTLGGTAGSGLGIGTPGSAGWWGAGTGLQAPVIGSVSMLDQAKAAYDKYVKPLKQVQSASQILNRGGGGDGGYPQPTQQQDETVPETAPTTYYPEFGGGQLPNYGGFPQLPNIGGAPQGMNGTGFNLPGGMSGYFDYLPDYIKQGVIKRRGFQ